MRNFFISLFLITSLLFLSSCEDNRVGSLETINFRSDGTGLMEMYVDHYRWIGGFEGFHFKYFTQEGSEIGTKKWTRNYSPVENFDYEWGYRYHLIVKKKKYDPPIIDSPPFFYELIKVVSKTKVDDVTFKIPIYTTCSGCTPILTGSQSDGYSLLNSKKIDCGNFCEELAEVKEKEKSIIAIFQNKENGMIILVGLES